MKQVQHIPVASQEIAEDEPESSSQQFALAKALEERGVRTYLAGRAIATIERSDGEDLPDGIEGWGVLKITLYPDPDSTGSSTPEHIYLVGGRFGLARAYREVGGEIEKLV